MVLKNLFTGSSGETDMENRLMDMGRGEVKVRCMKRVTLKFTLSYFKLGFFPDKRHLTHLSTLSLSVLTHKLSFTNAS